MSLEILPVEAALLSLVYDHLAAIAASKVCGSATIAMAANSSQHRPDGPSPGDYSMGLHGVLQMQSVVCSPCRRSDHLAVEPGTKPDTWT